MRAILSLGCPNKMVFLYPKNIERPLEIWGQKVRRHLTCVVSFWEHNRDESEEKTQRQGEQQASQGWSQWWVVGAKGREDGWGTNRNSRLLVTLKLDSREGTTSDLSHVPDQCWGLVHVVSMWVKKLGGTIECSNQVHSLSMKSGDISLGVDFELGTKPKMVAVFHPYLCGLFIFVWIGVEGVCS